MTPVNGSKQKAVLQCDASQRLTLLLLPPRYCEACVNDVVSNCPGTQACNGTTDGVPVSNHQYVLTICCICDLLLQFQQLKVWPLNLLSECRHATEM